LNGIGQVAAIPDVAVIHSTVSASEDNTSDALAKCNRQMADLHTQLLEIGILPERIATTNFTVRPIYANKRSIVEGWIVSNSIAIKVVELEKLGTVLTLVGGYGKVSGPFFSNSQHKELQNECRKLAIQDAIAKARLYCESASCNLIGIVEIDENQYIAPSYCDMDRELSPVEPGEQEISLTVRVEFEIENLGD